MSSLKLIEVAFDQTAKFVLFALFHAKIYPFIIIMVPFFVSLVGFVYGCGIIGLCELRFYFYFLNISTSVYFILVCERIQLLPHISHSYSSLRFLFKKKTNENCAFFLLVFV